MDDQPALPKVGGPAARLRILPHYFDGRQMLDHRAMTAKGADIRIRDHINRPKSWMFALSCYHTVTQGRVRPRAVQFFHL